MRRMRKLSALDISTDIVMVCATEFPSIRGLAKALEALDIVGLTEARRHFLLNRADAKVGVEADDIERAIGHTVDVRVPSSIDMVKATNHGIPIMEARSNDVLVKAFESLCDLFDPAKPAGGAADRGADGIPGCRCAADAPGRWSAAPPRQRCSPAGSEYRPPSARAPAAASAPPPPPAAPSGRWHGA